MYKTLQLISLAFLLAIQANGQEKGRFGFKVGYNSASMSSSINSDATSKGGINFGVYGDFKVNSVFHVQPEINYSSQGENENYIIPPTGASYGKTEVTLNYLNIPLILKFDMGKVVNFQVGPQLGLLLSAREKGTINNQPVDDEIKNVIKNDFSMIFGLGFNVSKNINLGARYNYGISNVQSPPPGAPADYPKVCNRVLNFFVGYTF